MALPIFPVSPLPANLSRVKDWNENVTVYDSGEFQGDTPYVKSLVKYTFPIKLMTETKQQAIWNFVDLVKGKTQPFLMSDPYSFQINSTMAAGSGVTNAATLFIYDVIGYMVRPNTATVSSLFSALSGFVTMGQEYGIEQDTGILTVNTKDVTDVWGVRSMTYYKKVHFDESYTDTSILWNLFSGQIVIQELP